MKIYCAKYIYQGEERFYSFWAKNGSIAVEHAALAARLNFCLSSAQKLSTEYKLVSCKPLKNGNAYQVGELTWNQSDLVHFQDVSI